MPYLLDLADACRKSGLKVVEEPGWKTRGKEMGAAQSVVCHHTAGPKTGNAPSLKVVRDGRAGLAGPLGNIVLGRDGTVHVVAAGRANHAGVVHKDIFSNSHAIGIEAEATGVDSWPEVQVDAYARLCAALSLHYGFVVSRVQGHKEVAVPKGRKIDPNFNMDAFRDRVRAHKKAMTDVNKPVRQALLTAEKSTRAAANAARKAGLTALAGRLTTRADAFKSRRISLRPKKK